MANKTTKTDAFIAWIALWVSRIALAVLAIAGAMKFLGGIDIVIALPFAFIGVALLLKETL